MTEKKTGRVDLWTNERGEELRQYYADHMPIRVIAGRMGVTPGAVSGKLSRMGLLGTGRKTIRSAPYNPVTVQKATSRAARQRKADVEKEIKRESALTAQRIIKIGARHRAKQTCCWHQCRNDSLEDKIFCSMHLKASKQGNCL